MRLRESPSTKPELKPRNDMPITSMRGPQNNQLPAHRTVARVPRARSAFDRDREYYVYSVKNSKIYPELGTYIGCTFDLTEREMAHGQPCTILESYDNQHDALSAERIYRKRAGLEKMVSELQFLIHREDRLLSRVDKNKVVKAEDDSKVDEIANERDKNPNARTEGYVLGAISALALGLWFLKIFLGL